MVKEQDVLWGVICEESKNKDFYICKNCNERFIDVVGLKTHIMQHALQFYRQLEDQFIHDRYVAGTQIDCRFCEGKFDDCGGLKRHLTELEFGKAHQLWKKNNRGKLVATCRNQDDQHASSFYGNVSQQTFYRNQPSQPSQPPHFQNPPKRNMESPSFMPGQSPRLMGETVRNVNPPSVGHNRALIGPASLSNAGSSNAEVPVAEVHQEPKNVAKPSFVPMDLQPTNLPFPGPISGVVSTVNIGWKDKVMVLNPKPLFHPDILNNLHNKSVGYLCNLGKDMIQELIVRTTQINQIFKTASTRNSQMNDNDPDLYFMYCRHLLGKILEARVYIDRQMNGKPRINADDFIELMSVKKDPVLPTELLELKKKFKGNRRMLYETSSNLKKIEWMSENMDPKNSEYFVQKMSEEKKRKELSEKIKELD